MKKSNVLILIVVEDGLVPCGQVTGMVAEKS